MKSHIWSNLGIAILVLAEGGFFLFSYSLVQADECCPTVREIGKKSRQT